MADRITVLTNPTSGKGRGERASKLAMRVFEDAGLHVRALSGRDADEALGLAQQCVSEGEERLVVCGGDGMIHIAAQALAQSEVSLGVIPAGTGNDFARYFDLPRRDPAAAARQILTGTVKSVDLAKVGSVFCTTVVAAGFDAIVNERANAMTWPKGQMRYNLATVAELRTFAPLPYVLDLDGVERRVDAVLVAIGNGPSYGGGIRITEGAVLDDGLLDVVIIKAVSKLDLLRTYPKLFKGTHTSHPQYEVHRVREVTVATPGVVAYADGERLEALPVRVECVPGALQVLV